MRIEVVCIGDELLRGETVNTNAAYLGKALDDAGLGISRETCIPDDRQTIVATLQEGLERADIIITIGGLGPTRDDVTRQAAACVLGVPLTVRTDVADSIEQFLLARAVDIPAEAVRNQATVPQGAVILPNGTGTAPGLWCRAATGAIIAMLPGPPRECRPMIDNCLVDRVVACGGTPRRCVRAVTICGLPESAVEQALGDIVPSTSGIAVGFCARPDGLRLRLEAEAEKAGDVDDAVRALRNTLGDSALPEGCATLIEHIGDLLKARKWTLGLAESCTGGLIAAGITDMPGVSAWFAGSAVTYSNEWKETMLGVPRPVLEQYGAVSEDTVSAMIAGLRQRFGVEAAVGVSGVAGPTGGSPQKPVGTVVIGVVVGDRPPQVTTYRFPGNRETVRLRTLGRALVTLRSELLACDVAAS